MSEPDWPKRAMYEQDGKTVVYVDNGEPNIELLEDWDGTPYPDEVQYAHAMVVGELLERIEKAKAALAYFGPQGAHIITYLEGESV